MVLVADVSDLELSDAQANTYLDRLGIDRGSVAADLSSLQRLHLAHLERIPFENLDIVFGGGVEHDQLAAVDKIIGSEPGAQRGGWCFELNGAFALLLRRLGFDVRMLGAAVLLDGPTQVIDHLLLEVEASGLAPHLADVGFGDSFDLPLALNIRGAQNGGSGDFELIASPQGTTLTRHVDGVPQALFRFKRVAHGFADFAATAHSLQVAPDKKWATHPFATKRLAPDDNGDPGRVTLSHDRLEVRRGSETSERAVGPEEWSSELAGRFGFQRPGQGSRSGS